MHPPTLCTSVPVDPAPSPHTPPPLTPVPSRSSHYFVFPLTVFTHTLCQPANPDQVVFSFFKAFRFFLSGTERGQEQQKCTRSGLGSEFITVESSLRLFLVVFFTSWTLFFVSREYPRLPPHPSPHCVQRQCALLYLLCVL